MAVTWGAIDQHQRVGIDIIVAAQTNTSITVHVDYYTQSVNWGFDDHQRLVLSGSVSGEHHFKFPYMGSGSTHTIHLLRQTFTWGRSYGGGPTFTFRATIHDQYLGGTPTHSRSYTVPARPPSPPGKVSRPSVSNIASSSAKASWGTPATNGASLNGYQLQYATNSAFTQNSVVHTISSWATNRTLTGLQRATRYWVRVRARNSAGYGAWSDSRDFTTAATVPDRPDVPTVTDVDQDGATVHWTAPNSGGASLSGYELQLATNPSFSGAQTFTGGTWATSRALSSLTPATAYWVRLRARNSVGLSQWSDATSFETQPGLRTWDGSKWVNVKAVRHRDNDDTWRDIELRKFVDGAWRL